MRDIAIGSLVFVLVSSFWWYAYVAPSDAYRAQIMRCMNDRSRSEYDRCSTLLLQEP